MVALSITHIADFRLQLSFCKGKFVKPRALFIICREIVLRADNFSEVLNSSIQVSYKAWPPFLFVLFVTTQQLQKSLATLLSCHSC